MPVIVARQHYVCVRSLIRGRTRALRVPAQHTRRHFTTPPRPLEQHGGKHDGGAEQAVEEKGALSRRLEEMTEQSLEQGGHSAQTAVKDAGFSEELRERLEERIARANLLQQSPTASAVLSMPTSAGQGTRDVASAKAWTGTETVEDASLRMLNDAHKPLRAPRSRRTIAPRLPPLSVDLRMKEALKRSKAERLANARDKTSMYAMSRDEHLTDKEKEEMRNILRDRFQSGARPMPTSIQGLSALANERIEDAIARGQFKNIPRGKGVNKEVDYLANSPFLDTTEYFMNKMIQRQEIVPPWIEKQQEVVKTASAFRARLRNDWKRHAARMIASKGGSLEDQVRRAEAYAAVEARLNPKPQKVEAISQIDSTGKLSQVNIIETTAPATDTIESKITVVETPLGGAQVAANVAATTLVPTNPTTEPSSQVGTISAPSSLPPPPSPPPTPPPLVLPPFRDPAWEKIELSYHSAALKELNSLTRSYNLMAPELAKKPYFSLERELASCFADVASQLPNEIRERARRPQKVRVEVIGHKPGSVLERFGGEKAKVYDSKRPNYGFKDFWRDLWGGRTI